MPFWVILIKIAKVVLTVRKYAALLSALSSGKLVESIISNLIIGGVRDALVKAGVPIDRIDFIDQGTRLINQVIDESSGDLAKHGLVLAPDRLRELFNEEVKRLLVGKSVANGREPVRGQAKAADPIILHRGEFERESVDLFIKAAGIDLGFRRIYRSGTDFIGPIGRGWDHAFNLRLIENDANILTRITGNLSVEKFTRHPRFGENGYSYFAPQNGVHDFVAPAPNGSFRLYRPRGVVLDFENAAPSEHRAKVIRDPSGNTLEFEYSTEDRLQAIYANGTGKFIHLTYDTRNRISSIEDHSGRTCVYEYDDFGYLISSSQWIEVGGKSYHSAELYEYDKVSDSRRLARVRDERGQIIVENVYDTRQPSATFGYVVEQVTEAGPTHFIYEALESEASGDLTDVDQPTMRVFETGPDGHVIERVFNDAGNELVRREDFTDMQSRKVALIRTRYNSDGAVTARMDPEGGLTQYLYGREQADPAWTWSDAESALFDVTDYERMAFGNQLSKVERGKAFGPLIVSAEQSDWILAIPSVKFRASADDAIIKYVYHPRTQLLVSQSDARHTESPDPLHVESAPAGTAAHNPSNKLAIAHKRLLTRFEYTTVGVLSRTVYPERTRPTSLGGKAALSNIVECVLRADSRGRPIERTDRHGYVWYVEYYPESITPMENARSGFVKREWRPHLDWILNEDSPDLLEIRRKGSWLGSATSMMSLGVNPATIELELEGARIELWQASDHALVSSHSDVTVKVDGAVQGSWNQSVESSYTIAGLSRGVHLVELSGAFVAPFAIGRVITHVRVDFDVDILGRVTRETDGRGLSIETEYDALDRVINVRKGAGVALASVDSKFNRHGQLTGEATIWRDNAGNPVSGGAVMRQYRYNARGLLEAETTSSASRAEVRATRYYYDQRAQPIAIRDGRGVRTTFRYDELGRRIRLTRAACTPDQSTTINRFDRCGRLLWERDPVGSVRIMGRLLPGAPILSGYDARGRLLTTTDARGHVTVMQYDASGRESVTSRFALRPIGGYELVHRIESIRDEHGDVVQTAVAIISEPIITSDPFGSPDAEYLVAKTASQVSEAVTAYELDAYGRQTAILNPSGGVTQRRFDPQGRLFEERLPSGRRTVRIYDGAGNLTRVYAFENSRSPTEADQGVAVFLEEYEYDALNRGIIQRDSFGNEWRETYDSIGNVTRSENPIGTSTAFEHNAFGEETKRTDGLSTSSGAAPAITQKSYDQSGNLIQIVDALGHQYKFLFDDLNRLKHSRNASFTTDPGTRYEYDRADRLVRSVDRNGLVQLHKYDAGGFRIQTRFDWSGVSSSYKLSSLSPTFLEFAYDALGNLVRHANDWATAEIRRNSLGLMLAETTVLKAANGLPASGWGVAQTFDNSGNRTRVTFPSGRVVAYSHDEAGRVTSVRNAHTPTGYAGSGLTLGSKVSPALSTRVGDGAARLSRNLA